MPGIALVVEPGLLSRNRIRDALLSLEFRVLEASGPGEALSATDLLEEDVDLLVTEVLLPRLSGIELAAQLVLKRPGTRVLYVSSQMSRFVGENATHLKGSAFLQKPFSSEQLLKRLQDLTEVL